MSVARTHTGHQTRYELREDTDEAQVSCALTYTANEDEPAVWKVLRPGPDGIEDVYSAMQFSGPDAEELRAWLTPVVGKDDAAELTDAVGAAPPGTAAWRSGGA
jgi:hypothetical protein